MDFKSYCRPFSTRITAGWRSSWALIELSVGLGGLYSDQIIVSGYEYNLLKYPAPNADILIRISAAGVIRKQIQRIGVYPYPITAQKPYPDNPCLWLVLWEVTYVLYIGPFFSSSLFWWLFNLYDCSVDRPRPFTV